MTTHAPYGPDAAPPPDYPQHPPTSAYPTAPPWATPPDAAPAYGSVTPYDAPYPQHGQLLVPFPEEMYNASRPKPPSWWPVVAWTVLSSLLGIAFGLAGIVSGYLNALGIVFCVVATGFSLIGIASASRRANVARRGRNSPAPYWVAWGVTMAVLSVISAAVLAVGLPLYLDYREDVVTKVVQSDLKHGKQLQESAGVTATSAICKPVGPRDAAGTRLYNCTLSLTDGRTGTLMVTADADGNWTAASQK